MKKFIKGLDDTEKNKELIQKYYKLSEIENKLMKYRDAKITDENGESLQGVTGRGDENKVVMTYRPFKTMPKKVIILPKKNIDEEKWYETMFEDGYFKFSLEDLKPGAEFKQAKDKSIVINSVEKSEDILKLNISYKGIDKLERFSMSTICLVETDKSLKDKTVCDDSEYIKHGNLDKEMAEAQENLDSVDITYNLDKNKKYDLWIQKSHNEDEYYDVNNRIEFDVK